MPQLDCSIVIAPEAAAQDVSTKTRIELHTSEGNWTISSDGMVLGRLTPEDVQRAKALVGCTPVSVRVTVRSVKRAPSSQSISHIQIRIASALHAAASAAAQPGVPAELLQAPELEDFTRDGRAISRAALEAVVADSNVRAALAREDVRALIAGVDAAPSREAALTGALRNPQLSGLCEHLLEIVTPAEATAR